MFKNEEGFSLLELSVAAAVAVIIAGAGYIAISGQSAAASNAVSSYEADNTEFGDALAANN